MKRRKKLLLNEYIQCVQVKFNKESSLQDPLMIYFNSKFLIQTQVSNIEFQMIYKYNLKHFTS